MKSKTICADSDTSHNGSGVTRRRFLLSSAAASLVAASSAQAAPQDRSAAGNGFPIANAHYAELGIMRVC